MFFPTKTPGLSVVKTTFEPALPSPKYQRYFFAGIRIILLEQNFNRCCPHLVVLLICFAGFIPLGKGTIGWHAGKGQFPQLPIIIDTNSSFPFIHQHCHPFNAWVITFLALRLFLGLVFSTFQMITRESFLLSE